METTMGNVRIRLIPLSFLLVGVFLFFSCAPSIKHYPRINQYLLTQDYDSAYKLVKKNKGTYAQRNAVLYYLDEGIISHFAGRYKESNQSFSRAESIMEELYTKSISKQVASFLISDNTIPYRGEDFEMAMVNLFMALNYVGLGNWEGALVEARKVDNKLSVINSKYEEGKKNVYKEDGISLWGPFLMWRTERGKKLIEKIAAKKRFWRGFGSVAIGINLFIMILLMIFQVITELRNSLGQKRDLYFRAAGVAVVYFVLLNYLPLPVYFHWHNQHLPRKRFCLTQFITAPSSWRSFPLSLLIQI